MADNSAAHEALYRDLATLTAYFNEELGEAETIALRDRLASDRELALLNRQLTEIAITRKIIRTNPELTAATILNDIRVITQNAIGPVDPGYALAVDAVCRASVEGEGGSVDDDGVEDDPAEDDLVDDLEDDEALMEILWRMAAMDRFCNKLHFDRA